MRSSVRRILIALASVAGLVVAYVVAHAALIEIGREVIVLRTREADGSWLETRLWIVDDETGSAWIHGDQSRWMKNLTARPLVEVVRRGEAHPYHATPVPGPHAHIHELFRAKYGFAEWWVRTVFADTATASPVRLDPVPSP